jgi:hypothetical protein
MLNELETLAQTAQIELAQLSSGDTLDTWNSRYIGRKGELTQLLRGWANYP